MNYTILQQNIMLQFETEFAKLAFLWASDRRDADRYLYKAEAYAHEVESLVATLEPMLKLAAEPFSDQWDDEKHEDLLRFNLKRHAHLRFPDAKTDWL